MSGLSAFLRVSAAVVVLLLSAHWQSAVAVQDASPPAILQDYLRAMYARDAAAAYALVSDADKHEKSLEEYQSETGRYAGAALTLARTLSEAIRFERTAVQIDGNTATVTFDAALPNANATALEPIVHSFDRERLSRLDASAVASRQTAIRKLAKKGRLPMLTSRGETWELVKDTNGWRVHLNWAEAVEVRFRSVVVGDLGWEFTPLRNRVLAKPGETIEMAYRVRNIGTHETTGKARHVIGPKAQAAHMEIISCFCFLEQTLAPDESVDMPLVFRIGFNAPDDLPAFDVLYEFYVLSEFPEGAAG